MLINFRACLLELKFGYGPDLGLQRVQARNFCPFTTRQQFIGSAIFIKIQLILPTKREKFAQIFPIFMFEETQTRP